MNSVTQFTFTYENLWFYQFQADWLIAIIAIVAGILMIVGSYYLIRLSVFFVMVHNNEQALRNKKKVLSELILMKDIQTELENEIEQAILKAAFRS